MMNTGKIEEGNELVRQAEKCLKTNLLKWRPEYDLAADYYGKAATAFRIGKSFNQSKSCHLKAADCYKHNSAWFHAARCYEQVILICKETNNFLEVEEYANKAANLYQQHGSPESAAAALDKAAKVVEKKHPDIALRFYQHAVEISMIEDSSSSAIEYCSKVSRILVKLRMYDQAADALRREIGLNQQQESTYGQIGRLTVVLVLVQLAREDQVAAEKAFKEWGNFCDPQEVQTLEMLLQAYDDEDPDTALRALASPFIKHMDVEYALLARDVPLPQGMQGTLKANPSVNAATSCASAQINLDEKNGQNAGSKIGLKEDENDEDGDEGLC